MTCKSLLKFSNNVYSQNGDDGVISYLFSVVGVKHHSCCEFGAWDGVHLSNCRRLILDGWRAVMIEADSARYTELVKTYADNSAVSCVNKYVDTSGNSVAAICLEAGVHELDFLSIDIDGLDYQIFQQLGIKPRVICVEVNAGHFPESMEIVPSDVARNNVGQSLARFTALGQDQGYSLVAYNGNAYFVRNDVMTDDIDALDSLAAYKQYLNELSHAARLWMCLVNMGVVTPYYRFGNAFLTRRALRLGVGPFLKELARCSRKIGLLTSARRILISQIYSLRGIRRSII